MDALELARTIADPLQVVGYTFYFDAGTRARAKELGLRGVQYYGLGRGGVLGDVDAARVAEVFAFFDDTAVDLFWTTPRATADPVAIAEEYLRSAYDFADRTFGGIDVDVLARFGVAARAVAETSAPGACPLVDGYRRFPAPADPVHAAYLGAIMLRELRGGLHVHAVAAAGLDPRSAIYLEDASLYASHGFREDEAPQVTDELRARKDRAEELTDEAMATALAVLDDAGRDAIAAGTRALFTALSEPVPVAR